MMGFGPPPRATGVVRPHLKAKTHQFIYLYIFFLPSGGHRGWFGHPRSAKGVAEPPPWPKWGWPATPMVAPSPFFSIFFFLNKIIKKNIERASFLGLIVDADVAKQS
jgi:hypothetical protein